jgi:hypothetical protein
MKVSVPVGAVTARVGNYATLIMQIVGNFLTVDTRRTHPPQPGSRSRSNTHTAHARPP